MGWRVTRCAFGAGSVTALCIVVSGSACSDLLEFEHSPSIECVRNSDCNPCQSENCNVVATNLVCSLTSHACVDQGEIAVKQDASTDGDTCAEPCPEFSVCRNQACLDFERHGYTGAGSSTEFVGRGIIVGIQLPLDVCGFVTGIGFVTAKATTNQRFRFGLYSDSGGQPDKLIAQTPAGNVQAGTNEVAVESPAPLGCTGATLYYWLIGAWDTDALEFQSESNPVDPWIYASVVTQDVIDGGLPAQFPAPGTAIPNEDQPHLYVLVAQSN